MTKEILNTKWVGAVVNTNEWMIGVGYFRDFPISDTPGHNGDLLEIRFLCFTIYVTIERKGRKS